MPDATADASWPWPDELDAVPAAPDSHRVLLENERIRVVQVVIEPGCREPVHTHRWPSVMIVDGRSPIRYYDADGELALETRSAHAAGAPPLVERMGPEGPHAVENVGSVTYHAIRVELKAELRSDAPPMPGDPPPELSGPASAP